MKSFQYFKSLCILLLILPITFLPSCSSSLGSQKPKRTSAKPNIQPIETPKLAPWDETISPLSADSFGNSNVAKADQFVSTGVFGQAVPLYSSAEVEVSGEDAKFEILRRKVGTMLKLGHALEALQEVRAFSESQGVELKDFNIEMSTLISYSYLALDDYDQALAWSGKVLNDSAGNLQFKNYADRNVKQIISAIPDFQLPRIEERWRTDPTINQLLREESSRRISEEEKEGSSYSPTKTVEWFSPAFYSSRYRQGPEDLEVDSQLNNLEDSKESADISSLDDAELPKPAEFSKGEIRVGILLPLNGKYAEHGHKVRQGLELAVEDFDVDKHIKIVIADSKGDPKSAREAYRNLVSKEGVSFVFGPLLAETSYAVAKESTKIGVPILSFSKIDGLTNIGPNVFRLAPTVEDQVLSLVSYVVKNGLSDLIIFRSNDLISKEFADAFEGYVEQAGGGISRDFVFSTGESSLPSDVAQYLESSPSLPAVFIPGNFDGAKLVSEYFFNKAGQNKEENQVSLESGDKIEKPLLLGTALWNDSIAIRGLGQLIDGAIFVSPFLVTSNKDQVVRFVKRFNGTYHQNPEVLSAQAYDAMHLFIQAVYSEGSEVGGQNIFQRIDHKDQPLKGVTGDLRIDSLGEIRRTMGIIKIVKGELKEVN